MIRAYVVNEAQVSASMDRRGALVVREVRIGIGRLALKLQRMVKTDKLRGQVLGWRTGRLAGSINQIVLDEAGKIVGVVSTNVGYGIGWELGWPSRKTLASAKSRFSVSSGETFANGTPKRRSFLASALKDLEASGVIRAEMDAAIERATR